MVAKRDKEASAENGPEFLGGSLMFIKALEVLTEIKREKAFDFVERASQRAGFGLQIHVDDDHGKIKFFDMTDKKIIETIENHHTGCGFSEYAWENDNIEVIKEAKLRKWRVQILVGSHHEQGATIDYREGTTFDNAQALKFNESKFNLDEKEAVQIFNELEIITGKIGFSQKAVKWMLDTYRDVVVTLKGVKKTKDVVEIN